MYRIDREYTDRVNIEEDFFSYMMCQTYKTFFFLIFKIFSSVKIRVCYFVHIFPSICLYTIGNSSFFISWNGVPFLQVFQISTLYLVAKLVEKPL